MGSKKTVGRIQVEKLVYPGDVMKKTFAVAILSVICYVCVTNISRVVSASTAEQNTQNEVARLTSDLPFPLKIRQTSFPNRDVKITDFGAVGNGRTMNTEAFAKAIDNCAKAGGGRVIVPPGIWLTGPIQLKSNINLHLEKNSVILFSTRFEDYPLVRTTWEGSPAVRCMSPIYGVKLENIAITGDGVIDGSGDAWRAVRKNKLDEPHWKELVASGGVLDKSGNTWWPSTEAMTGAETVRALDKRGPDVPIQEYAAAREYLRPVLVSLVECKRILLDGPTFQNSPAWNLHPLLSEDIVIRNVTVLNPWYGQNGDGIDIESCRRVALYNSRFDAGDDAICVKSGRDEFGRKRGRATEDLLVSDCIVYHGHGGFTIGSEMSGGVRNVVVRRCTFLGTDMGLRFKTTRGRGGVVEKIWISDIMMKDIPTDAIGFNMYYNANSPILEPGQSPAPKGPASVNDGTPQFRDIYLKNIICRGAARAVQIEGLPEMPIHGIHLDNIQIAARTGITCVDAEQIDLKNLHIDAKIGPVVTIRDSTGVTLDKIASSDVPDTLLKIEGEKTKDVKVANTDMSKSRKPIEYAKGATEAAVIKH